ncbi:hypothetical protein AAK967_04670 [Atopobiaceae bacterium 24-176]
MARTLRDRVPSPDERPGRPNGMQGRRPGNEGREAQGAPAPRHGATPLVGARHGAGHATGHDGSFSARSSHGSVAASAAHRAARAQARHASHGSRPPLRHPSTPHPPRQSFSAGHHRLTGPGTLRPNLLQRLRALIPTRTGLRRPGTVRRNPLVWAVVAVAITVVALVGSWAAGSRRAAQLAPAQTAAVQAVAAGPQGLLEAAPATAQAATGLTQAIGAIEATGATAGWYLCTTDGTAVLAHNADTAYYAASAIKGPYVLSVLSDNDSGAPGRYQDSLSDAIVNSDNDAYYRVKSAFGTDRINQWLAQAGSTETLDETNGSFVDLTPRQLAGLWVQAYPYIEGQEAVEDSYAASIFSEPSHSVIPELEGVTESWSKPGWIAVDSASSTVNAGVVERGEAAYIIAVMTDDGDDFERFDELVAAVDALGQLAVTVVAGPEAAGQVAVTEAG